MSMSHFHRSDDRPGRFGCRLSPSRALLLAASALLVWEAVGPGRPTGAVAGPTGFPDALSAFQLFAAAARPADPEASAAPRGTNDRPALLHSVRAHGAEVFCTVTVDAAPLAAALVGLGVSAPCHGGARVKIAQGPVTVTARLDAAGTLTLEFPALSDAPALTVTVMGRAPVTVQTWAADHDRWNRAVLHWRGGDGPELHAFEDGAERGGAGHVAPDAPGDVAAALTGTSGFLTALGDPSIEDGRRALVYTAPADTEAALSVEARVTDRTCGRIVEARAIRMGPGLADAAFDLALTMPDCESSGAGTLAEAAARHVRGG
jgi:hypothetical protein